MMVEKASMNAASAEAKGRPGPRCRNNLLEKASMRLVMDTEDTDTVQDTDTDTEGKVEIVQYIIITMHTV
jgi:hypothetical protein